MSRVLYTKKPQVRVGITWGFFTLQRIALSDPGKPGSVTHLTHTGSAGYRGCGALKTRLSGGNTYGFCIKHIKERLKIMQKGVLKALNFCYT